ncbi:hypothetical protein TBLA_0H03000 [Henningerozyma blattae CBS 6284]|uniref:Uncharacterized protein n=1 Tax=Henningerozyma blattae (strain ATCC 34711 / CBS 6284 / DSM 70876 / NBRC 10599 / NRRL Y-10934 / UCD 77-7) TaxID=1071380 RepID=I2H881_HENB6|nr:hypothetical protein TBLA_0H03000 [Tetrapisispora blattae CBS 6284]CCH62583.1 hypothetical protein TBLA_0H03000 [Tetrapisispora blattae CBS 6284]
MDPRCEIALPDAVAITGRRVGVSAGAPLGAPKTVGNAASVRRVCAGQSDRQCGECAAAAGTREEETGTRYVTATLRECQRVSRCSRALPDAAGRYPMQQGGTRCSPYPAGSSPDVAAADARCLMRCPDAEGVCESGNGICTADGVSGLCSGAGNDSEAIRWCTEWGAVEGMLSHVRQAPRKRREVAGNEEKWPSRSEINLAPRVEAVGIAVAWRPYLHCILCA